MQILTRLMRCCQTQLRLGSVNRLFRCRSIIAQLGKMFYEYHGSMHSKRCATEEKKFTLDVKKHTPRNSEKKSHVQKSQVIWIPCKLEEVQGSEEQSDINATIFKTLIFQ